MCGQHFVKTHDACSKKKVGAPVESKTRSDDWKRWKGGGGGGGGGEMEGKKDGQW